MYIFAFLAALILLSLGTPAMAGIPIPPAVPELDPGMLALLGSSMTAGYLAVKHKFPFK